MIVRLPCPDAETACDNGGHCCCMGCEGDGWITVEEDSEQAQRIRAKLAEQEAQS